MSRALNGVVCGRSNGQMFGRLNGALDKPRFSVEFRGLISGEGQGTRIHWEQWTNSGRTAHENTPAMNQGRGVVWRDGCA